MVVFGPFRLDLADERLWRGTTELAVRRKPFAILKYLASHPQKLVTHAELLEHVWEGNVVSESTVRTQLHELRQLLGEGVIETVIGRGYRFTATIVDEGAANREVVVSDRIVVGRAAELALLDDALRRADGGHRQICFVTGEPGIGKTTLVDAFVEALPEGAIAVRGHCVEQHGTPEPYLAIIEVLGRLRQSELGRRTLEVLLSHAPMFCSHVPQLVPDEDLARLRAQFRDGSEARMVRELVDAIETLASQQTLVLVLEDLQWSDVATLDLLAQLGARRERARLLVVATSRRVEAQTVTHPLNPVMRNLVARARATAISLDRVAVDDIRELLALRFPVHQFPAELIETLDRITAGTPLFLVSVLDDLVGRNMLAQRDGTWRLTASLDDVRAHRPSNVKQLIDIRLDRLFATEQRVLEAASVVGAEFSSGLVAAALEMPAEDVDEICDGLARRQLFLRRETGEPWPDGTLHTHYGVTHALVQEVCLARSAPARRARWHRLVGEQLEAAWGERSGEIAHTLAMHYERGHVIPRAVQHFLAAAERTALRFASLDSLALFRRAYDLLPRVPDGADRDRFELRARAGIAAGTLRTTDPSNPEPAQHLERMVAIARSLDDKPRLCAALLNIAFRFQLRADHRGNIALCAEIDELVKDPSMPVPLARFAEAMNALNRMWRGKFDGIAEIFTALLDEGDMLETPELAILGPTDRRTVLNNYLAVVHFCTGDRDRARHFAERALARATVTKDPFGLGLALLNVAWLHLVCGDPTSQVRELAERVFEIAGAEIWRPAAEIFAACDRPVDPATAERLLAGFRASIPAIPMGTTRLGIAVIHMLRTAGLDAQPLVDELVEFAKTHEERVVEALLK
jgi:DNA-binding winged helix-turn-helix (wHTH) protein